MPDTPSDKHVVEAIYSAMAARDFAALFELVHTECVLTQDERLPWGGRHVGHDGIATFGAALTGAIDSQVTTEALFEANGSVYQFGHTRGTTVASKKTFDVAEVHTWTIRDGKAIAAHFAIDTEAMLSALSIEGRDYLPRPIARGPPARRYGSVVVAFAEP